VLTLLLNLVAEAGSSLLMVTHSARLAGRLSQTLLLHQGRIRVAAS